MMLRGSLKSCAPDRTPDNQSHFTDVTIELAKESFASPATPIAIGGNKPTLRASSQDWAHWGATDLQTDLNQSLPCSSAVTVLQGVFSISVTDGETRQVTCRYMVLLEDITPCRGHITVVVK